MMVHPQPGPHLPPLVACPPYRLRLLEAACVSRYRAGKPEHCNGCHIGAERAGEKPKNPYGRTPRTLFEAVSMAVEEARTYRSRVTFFVSGSEVAAMRLVGLRRGETSGEITMPKGESTTKTCKKCDRQFRCVKGADPGYRYCLECSSPRWNLKQSMSAACRLLRFFGFDVETTDTPKGAAILVRGRPKEDRKRSGEKHI